MIVPSGHTLSERILRRVASAAAAAHRAQSTLELAKSHLDEMPRTITSSFLARLFSPSSISSPGSSTPPDIQPASQGVRSALTIYLCVGLISSALVLQKQPAPPPAHSLSASVPASFSPSCSGSRSGGNSDPSESQGCPATPPKASRLLDCSAARRAAKASDSAAPLSPAERECATTPRKDKARLPFPSLLLFKSASRAPHEDDGEIIASVQGNAATSTVGHKKQHYQLARLSREAADLSAALAANQTGASQRITHAAEASESTTPRKLQRRRSRANSLALLFTPSSTKRCSDHTASSTPFPVDQTEQKSKEAPETPSRRAMEQARALDALGRERRYDELHLLISLIDSSGAACVGSPRSTTVRNSPSTASMDGRASLTQRRRAGAQHGSRLELSQLVSSEEAEIERALAAGQVRRVRADSLFGLFGQTAAESGSDAPAHTLLQTPRLRSKGSMPLLSLSDLSKTLSPFPSANADICLPSSCVRNGERGFKAEGAAIGLWSGEDPLRLSLGFRADRNLHDQLAEYTFPARGDKQHGLPSETSPFWLDCLDVDRALEIGRVVHQALDDKPAAALARGIPLSRSVPAFLPVQQHLRHPSSRGRSRHATVETLSSTANSSWLSMDEDSEAEATVRLRPLSIDDTSAESTLLFDPETSDDQLIRDLIYAFPSPRSSDAGQGSPVSMLTFAAPSEREEEVMTPDTQDEGFEAEFGASDRGLQEDCLGSENDVDADADADATLDIEQEAAAILASLTDNGLYRVARRASTEELAFEPVAELRKRDTMANSALEVAPEQQTPPSSAGKLLRQISLTRRPSLARLTLWSNARRNSSVHSMSTIDSIASDVERTAAAVDHEEEDEEDRSEERRPFYLEDDQVYWPQILSP